MLNRVACIHLLVAWLVALLVACSGDEPAPRTPTPTPAAPVQPARPAEPTEVAPPAAPAESRVAPTDTVAPSPAAVSPGKTPGNWRDRTKADLAAMRASSPAQLDALNQLAPAKTRAQLLRFTSDAIHDPRAASVFIDRLARGGDDEAVRAALVEALPRTGGAFADAAIDLIATERSAVVRAAYVFAARRAPGTHAVALIKRGLGDASPEVQAEAARSAAAHPEGKRVGPELRAMLAAADASVRAEAARSLGILKIADARDALVATLADASPDVRLESLRAIDRIEPGFAAKLPLAKLAKDSDPRMAALASRLSAQPAPN